MTRRMARLVGVIGDRRDERLAKLPRIRRIAGPFLVLVVSITFLAQPVGASGESAAHGAGSVHVLLELLQLAVGILAVGAAVVGVKSMRGGHMEVAFNLLTVGVLTFLVQRVWHSAHEFGLAFALPGLLDQLLFLGAMVTMALGFLQVYRVMQPAG